MPIEIKELTIKVSVSANKESSGSPDTTDRESMSSGEENKEDKMDELAEQIMEIIKDKTER